MAKKKEENMADAMKDITKNGKRYGNQNNFY